MKSDISIYVSRCTTCQQVKADHRKTAGFSQPLEIPNWKWDLFPNSFEECYSIWTKGKASSQILGPFSITERIDTLAYRVALLEKLTGVHNVSHVSHLHKVVRDPSMTISTTQLEELDVEPDLTTERRPLRMVDKDTKQLRRKSVSLVKVQWSSDARDCTWEIEESIRASNPELFT